MGRRLSAKRQANLDKAALKLVETSYEGGTHLISQGKGNGWKPSGSSGGQQRALELLGKTKRNSCQLRGYNTLARLSHPRKPDAGDAHQKNGSKPKRWWPRLQALNASPAKALGISHV